MEERELLGMEDLYGDNFTSTGKWPGDAVSTTKTVEAGSGSRT